jgi:hypothetical protein
MPRAREAANLSRMRSPIREVTDAYFKRGEYAA